jgi:hypothetical protein
MTRQVSFRNSSSSTLHSDHDLAQSKDTPSVNPQIIDSCESPLDLPPQNKNRHQPLQQSYEYYICVDFEATCERDAAFEYPNEIIEFPAILLNGKTFETVSMSLFACLFLTNYLG